MLTILDNKTIYMHISIRQNLILTFFHDCYPLLQKGDLGVEKFRGRKQNDFIPSGIMISRTLATK